MDAGTELSSRYIRVVALISLILGLSDAARLLGVSMGEVSPLTAFGTTGFVYLGIFSLARLFAAVGLWIHASWGAVILVAATSLELTLYLTGNPNVQMTTFELSVRVLLLASMLAIFVLGLRLQRARVHD